jgi:fluoroacetyl-CoA thioesterase
MVAPMSPSKPTPPTTPPAQSTPDAFAEMVVTERDLASAYAARADERYPDVLATPALIGLMERACAACLQPGLRAGEMSVGVRVAVTHKAPTPIGAQVLAQARWRRTEGALHVFDVEARDAGGIVASGEHARAVVAADQITDTALRRVSGRANEVSRGGAA